MVKQICAARAVLRPRELRPVHAVPRRHGVDDEDPRAHRGGRRASRKTSTAAARPRREHDGQDDLRAERFVRGAGRERHPEVPRRVRGATSRQAVHGAAGGLMAVRLDGGSWLTQDWSTSRSTGRRSPCPKGTSILEAAKRPACSMPHYCYHPSLPVAGVCRMCLVEVEKAPKLVPACVTAVAEGQVVHVHSREGARRRARACSRCC